MKREFVISLIDEKVLLSHVNEETVVNPTQVGLYEYI